ncbi:MULTISPECIES: extracellular solute-binding protein [Paenibacillus]|uniref:ABC transporter substrate-binding protein n=1 Tax=Paenibacillus campinasensis TaxID=66347 RepID=A0A268EJ03_9BACL|nr:MULTISPECIES: extracellular solute-binding protein [Paenibacillus]MUG67944.1 extracellular solute-binding protein [Paenibacillus campinasensis]PAD73101.1 ABC transporter substrate-binding protein [Paenibacillus campinasensis]PAK49666.1 ABC transporter substrate-binding protein [Paenibacillus sp. 7541]
MKKVGLLGLTLLLVFLTACSGGGSSTGPASAGADGGGAVKEETPDPFGKYEETITLTYGKSVDATDKSLPVGDTPETNQYSRYVKDMLNIDTKVSWQAASGPNYDQKVNLSISSNDLPDALVVNDMQLRQMVKAGQLADLTDIYDRYASPSMKSFIEKTGGIAAQSVTFDGKMYAIPSVQVHADGVHQLWIRKDWLDKLGLEPPRTIDDLEKVAEAFVTQDPDGNGKDDTIGISGPESGGLLYAHFLASTNNLYGLDPVFGAFRAYPGFWIEGEDGDPVYGSILPETKEALGKLRDWYAKGLIDREIGVRKDAHEPVKSGQSGIFFAPWWMGYGPLPDAIKNDPDANWQAYLLPLDSEGQFNARMGTSSTQFVVVRKDYEHPEAVVKMLNLLIRDEAKFDISVGIGYYPLRVPQSAPDESEYSAKALQEVLAGTKTPEDFNDPGYKLLAADLQNVKKVKKEPYDNMDIQYWDPQADLGVWSRQYSLLVGASTLLEDYNKVYSLLYSQTKTMESRWTNLKKLEDETFLKIIVGAAPLEEFDTFVDNWKKQGGDKITEEVKEYIQQ